MPAANGGAYHERVAWARVCLLSKQGKPRVQHQGICAGMPVQDSHLAVAIG